MTEQKRSATQKTVSSWMQKDQSGRKAKADAACRGFKQNEQPVETGKEQSKIVKLFNMRV